MKRALVAWCLVGAACAVRLDEPSVKQKPKVETPVAVACRWFPAGDRVSGRVSSVPLGNGNRLVIADRAGSLRNAGYVVAEDADADGCFGAETVEHSVLSGNVELSALAPVSIGGVPWLFYARLEPVPGEVFPVRTGIGVARWDEASERFIPSETLLWTGDRPSYGTGAIVDGDQVYVYGCQDGSFLSKDCFIARAPASAIDDESAYSYYAGGGNFVASIDDAYRVLEAGDPLSVAPVPGRDRFVAAYVTPLGGEVVVRTGLTPFGPWSKPIPAFGCELTAKDSFCGDAVLHPFSTGLFVSYSIGSFTPGAADADPLAFWSRVSALELPAELP